MPSVLIVDDDPFIRRLIATTLEDVGTFELVQASDGQEAVEVAEREAPILVFLDVDMPRLDGIETCRRIRSSEATSGARIVMLTAAASADDETRARAAGADLFMRKPFSPLDLLELVERVRDADANGGELARPRTSVRAFVGLGSNVGDRLASLRAARKGLDRGPEDGARVAASSAVYETAPLGEGTGGQRDYLNACVAIETTQGPEELLDLCKSLELSLGRTPGGMRNAPRPIDIDLLLVGDLEHDSERLRLPHPSLSERRFVLVPLLELAPELSLPDGTPLASFLDRTGDQRVDPFATNW